MVTQKSKEHFYLYLILRATLISNDNPSKDMDKYDKDGNKIFEIVINVEKFKEILIYSWDLLSLDKQQELLNMGIYPKPAVSRS